MEDKKINKGFWQDFDKTVTQTLVPRFSVDIVRPCEEGDFQNFRETLSDNLNHLVSLLDLIIENKKEWNIQTKKNLVKVIAIVGEEHCKSAWNKSEDINITKTLIAKICNIFEKENLTEILKDDDIFLSVVMFLRPKLLKDTWKSFPSAVVCYKWLLKLVEKPLLKRHIPEVLPTALIIFDDYVHENQAIGLECINLIIEHCQNSRSLKNFNYDEVIFQALQKMAYKVETNMIISLYSCISNLLDNIQYCENSSNAFCWNKRDDILSILLENMELQSNVESRYAYAVSLLCLLKHSSTGRWSERITRILSEYCEEITDLKTTSASLDLLQSFLAVYQPKSINFYTKLYCSLLKLSYRLKSIKKNTLEIDSKLEQCFSLLNKCSPNLGKEVLSNDKIHSILNTL